MFHHCHPTTHLLVALTQSIKSSLDSLCSGPSRYLVAFSRLTRLVMLDGGGPGYTMLYPSWRSQKWVPPKYIQIVVTFQIEPFFISMIVRKGKSGEVWTWLKPFWHSKRSANNHQRHHSREPGLDPRPLKRIFTAPCPTVSMMPQRSAIIDSCTYRIE